MGNTSLDGQVAIVTGAARGLGCAFGRRLRAEGCEVVVTDRLGAVEDVASEIGATGHVGDVADADHVRSVVDATVGRHGRIDVLVNNAGEVMPSHALSGFDDAPEDFDRIVGTNTRGAFLFGRAVAPVMVDGGRGGHIVNVSTDHVKPAPGAHRHHGHGGMDLYNASKWALNGLTFDWARSLGRHGIRVNNLNMGATDTEMLRGFLGRPPTDDELATWMTPEQIAQILVELLTEGPDGRTADSIGLYAGFPVEMPPPE